MSLVNKVSISDSLSIAIHQIQERGFSYTRSSDTLCSPEGRDLYSTMPSTLTIFRGVSSFLSIDRPRISRTTGQSTFPRDHISANVSIRAKRGKEENEITRP